MEAKIIRSFLSKVPAVICTAGSYIASKNLEAKQRLGWLFEGGMLFERMSAENVLKYEAHFASCRAGDAFSFTVSSAEGPWLAVALFDSIYSRRFAEVLFFKSREEMERELCAEASELTNEEKIGFVTTLLGIAEKRFEPLDRRGLIDLKKSTSHLTSKLEKLGISAVYSENEEAKNAFCIPQDIPMVSYLQMVMMISLALGSISPRSAVSLRLSKYGKNAELAVSSDDISASPEIQGTDDFLELYPFVLPYISICRYVASICGCAFDMRRDSANQLSLVLSMGEQNDIDVDFKSRDSLLYFDEGFEFSLKYISALSADAEQ